jgi:hypothetical protein
MTDCADVGSEFPSAGAVLAAPHQAAAVSSPAGPPSALADPAAQLAASKQIEAAAAYLAQLEP